MNIAIIDDDKNFIENFCSIIKKHCDEYSINYTIDSFYDGYSIIENYNKYDLIFLDIEMPYINGIETAKQINEFKGNTEIPLIVFVTGKDNLVFTALKQFPYAYLRKTHFREDIAKCVINVNKILNKKATRYSVKVGRSIKFMNIDDILYIEKDKNYVVLHTSDMEYKERSNIDKKLYDLSSKGFIRTHIGYLVNLKYISEISGNEVILNNRIKIPISKSYKQAVKDQYFDWVVKEND